MRTTCNNARDDFRINLMSHRNDVPGRDVERYERWGIAPSVALGGDSSTRVTLAFTRQEDDNIPQYGVPHALSAFNDGPLPGVPTSGYYGYSNVDRQEIGVDAFTTTVSHDFSETVSLRNLTRWQQVDQFSFVDQPQGAWCVQTGINPWTGAACAVPGTFVPNRGGTVRDGAVSRVVGAARRDAEFHCAQRRRRGLVPYRRRLQTDRELESLHRAWQLGDAVASLRERPDRSLFGGTIDILAGDPLPNTPEHSASVWTTCQVSPAFRVGWGVTYQGEYTFARTSCDGEPLQRRVHQTRRRRAPAQRSVRHVVPVGSRGLRGW